METAVANGGIATYSGRVFYPLQPDYREIAIEDIAHALSNSCRFTGHTKKFYSVGQHSVLVSEVVPPEDALTGLLHDASEAYLSDFARPIKQQAGFGEEYKLIEDILMAAISKAFPIKWPVPESVKAADYLLLTTEQRDLMPNVLREEGETLENEIVPWTPDEAEAKFLDRYEQLTGKQEYMI